MYRNPNTGRELSTPYWMSRKPNMRFLNALHAKFGYNEFTVKQSYPVYYEGNIKRWAKKNFPDEPSMHQPDNWTDMNARNALCQAVYSNFLIRVRRGVYKFTR